MRKVIDLTGKQFGRWTVVCQSNRNRRGIITWFCQCECGTTKYLEGAELRAGRSKSCGCLAAELTTQRQIGRPCKNRLPKGESGFNALFASYKKIAKKRNFIFELTKEQFRKLVQQPCFYCGKNPTNTIFTSQRTKSWGQYIYNGVDRIDNTKGYTINNCVSCCKQCNLSKRNLSQQEFLNWVEGVHNYSILRGHRMTG